MQINNQRIYHILIDRFTGDAALYSSRGFTGGTLNGIISHLDYIREQGFTGIMLTPFYKTVEYHGYHITDYDEVDPHFGTWDDVDRLVAETHRRGMTIIADFVANHCHESNALYQEHREWFRHDRHGRVKGFAGFGFLPMFDTDNAEARDYLTERGLALCRRGFDALRLDHATGPSYAFWKYFRKRIKAEYPDVMLIGEVWGELDFKPRNIIRYLFNFLRYTSQEARQLEYVGILDGVLDFSYQHLLCRAAHKGSSILSNRTLYKEVKTHFARYPTTFQLWLFLDNHDLNRFLFECGGNKTLLKEGIEFSRQWNMPWLMFYGTEKEFTNNQSIFDGTPYADERVRMCFQ